MPLSLIASPPLNGQASPSDIGHYWTEKKTSCLL